MIVTFVVVIIIGVTKYIPKMIDEFNDKKSDIDVHITKAKDEIINEINKD